MWKMIGPHQGLRLERMRTEIERDRFASGLKHLPELTEPKEENNQTQELVDTDEKSQSTPSNDLQATQSDADGYEWLDYDGGKWYRATGSNAEWTKFES